MELAHECDEVLMQLARNRSEALKDYLVEKQGVAAERLFICHPQIDKEEEALPRVELVI